MTEPEIVWASVMATGLAYEAVALWRRRHATLSVVTRRVFRTETVAGRRIFTISWTLFAAWLLWHILDPEGAPSI